MIRLSQKAQSAIEYSTLIILVIVGIILMRPYVIRAINAHMKSWEDAYEDSMTDPLKEVPAGPGGECGDGDCTGGEDEFGCCQDCGWCNDTVCCTETGEDVVYEPGSFGPDFCVEDCGYCGERICFNESIEEGCCADCSTCGDGCCCTTTAGCVPTSDIQGEIDARLLAGELIEDIRLDLLQRYPVVVDSFDQRNESNEPCTIDCPHLCDSSPNDGECEEECGETPENSCEDCGDCPDTICCSDENVSSCPDDCCGDPNDPSWSRNCPDGTCQGVCGENPATCSADCQCTDTNDYMCPFSCDPDWCRCVIYYFDPCPPPPMRCDYQRCESGGGCVGFDCNVLNDNSAGCASNSCCKRCYNLSGAYCGVCENVGSSCWCR